MPRFCANLSMMFTELPFLDRFAAAADAGFAAVEFLFPYEHDPATLRVRLRGAGLAQILFNAPPGDWAGGERGTACLPGREAEFRAGILQALDYAEALETRLVHVMAGIPPQGLRPGQACALYAVNLAWAAGQAARRGVRLLLEPINQRDMPGYLLRTTGQAAALIEALGRERAGLQLDLYHCQITEGDLTRRIGALMALVDHIQIADVPDRHEPGSGEINWPWVLAAIDRSGYRGWVGCEYRPRAGTLAGLGWRDRFSAPGQTRDE